MTSSLVAFAVGDFEFVESTSPDFSCKLYAIRGRAEAGQFAADICRKAVLFYENYFAMKFPLKKLDIVRILCNRAKYYKET